MPQHITTVNTDVRLSRGEFWLLGHFVDMGCGLNWLLEPNIEEIFNKPSHRLSREQLIETLVGMFDRGWLGVSAGDQEFVDHESYKRDGRLDRPGIIAALDEKGYSEQSCWLSPEGGAVWEAFAAPNWEYYLEGAGFVPQPDDGNPPIEIKCMAKWFLERYLTALGSGRGRVEVVAIDEIGEWDATYWKRLPHGFRATIRNTADAWGLNANDLWLEQNQSRLAQEMRDGWCRWR